MKKLSLLAIMASFFAISTTAGAIPDAGHNKRMKIKKIHEAAQQRQKEEAQKHD